MKPLRLVPRDTAVPFVKHRLLAFAFSAALVLGSIAAVLGIGLNFGIDFKGGTLIEVRTSEPANIGQMRSDLNGLDLGEISLQEFGSERDVLIRIQRQEGEEAEQIKAIEVVRNTLPADVEFRRTEFVGPTVGQELIEAGILAVGLALLSILIYIWFRFEWQFGVGAIVALSHDIISTLGLFAIIQHEFNLATVAAVLTIAGYSINDTVVVYDRVRENLRRYKTMPLAELFNISVNDTLSRTTMTSLTTLLALFAIYFFGGAVLADFALAMIWGIVVGTYSSIFIAVPLLLYTGLRRGDDDTGDESMLPEYERTVKNGS
ncbi:MULTISPECIES: protein translocase subunit SecF [Thalassobaculum]|uniref:Protein-export membrane protein SecF n=1 Tax=Thalassobaculum litoreum DSM 18839 TaxID=1123362 RepID=A0A8G2BEH6_9PROT|nr:MULTISPECIES: protein translocase subunit SecF [Thalassobaculum]SDF16216.1 preprotein translocase subunit SecF [Thalassobaculum litoreum DSM 18839]